MATTAPSSPAAVAAAPDAAGALAAGVAARRDRQRAEVAELEAALEFARAHRVTTDARAASWGESDPGALFGDRPLALAGRGAPRVAEFAPPEWAAALGVSHEAALCMLGDVLDLAVRLPRTWALVRSGKVPARLGRLAAQESRDLDQPTAAHADRLLSWRPSRLNPHRVGVLVHEARLYADPDRAAADHDAALERRYVEVVHGHQAPGTSTVRMVLDEAHGVAFDHTVSQMATTMRTLGHEGSLDVRRAHAVGVLADPQSALDLIAGDPADATVNPDPDNSTAVVVAEDIAYARGNPFSTPNDAGRGAVLVFHLTDRDLLDSGPLGHGGLARSPKLGPIALDRLAGWLAGAGEITIRPVLDPDTIRPVDSHDPPERMAHYVRLRDQTCIYPRCTVPAERTDLDHTIPYVPLDAGGPPGQTSIDNLACLCRKHHRAKTFGHFTYQRRPDGSYAWTLPTGHTVTTDPVTPRPRPARAQRQP